MELFAGRRDEEGVVESPFSILRFWYHREKHKPIDKEMTTIRMIAQMGSESGDAGVGAGVGSAAGAGSAGAGAAEASTT